MTPDPFGNPLPSVALDAFALPGRQMHPFSRPMRGDGEIMAANGYMALRAYRGHWLDRDYPNADAAFLERLNRLPWERYQAIRPEAWRPIDSIADKLRFRGTLALWQAGTTRLSPSPVWRVGRPLARLSMLQLLARLPRCELAWQEFPESPLWFRCSGARGCIAHDPKLTLASFDVWQPRTDVLTGQLMPDRPPSRPKRNFGTPPPPEPTLDDWPPTPTPDAIFP